MTITLPSTRGRVRDFRQTRPFWGGLLLILAGAAIIHFAGTPVSLSMATEWNSSAGYVLGGGLVLFGLVSWLSPDYAPLLGLLGVLVALVAFVSANLGGLLIGTVLGIVGGSMVWAWGEKKPAEAGLGGESP
ncbi:DUF6114 domain-containing protein [Demetria terragena]|uniref:DUF6114 domain-containing protein n=1 Tax=Demetria terragena TaxID=63959 RepID=UPI000372EA2D|nr:DUF6114 domain-containing protein [Demetria terragena]